MTEHKSAPLISDKFKGQAIIVKGTKICHGQHVKSPAGLCCDIAVLLHRVVKEYITLHSQPGSLYKNNNYIHAPAIDIYLLPMHQPTVLVVGTPAKSPRRHTRETQRLVDYSYSRWKPQQNNYKILYNIRL